jgi:hypothetical protein
MSTSSPCGIISTRSGHTTAGMRPMHPASAPTARSFGVGSFAPGSAQAMVDPVFSVPAGYSPVSATSRPVSPNPPHLGDDAPRLRGVSPREIRPRRLTKVGGCLPSRARRPRTTYQSKCFERLHLSRRPITSLGVGQTERRADGTTSAHARPQPKPGPPVACFERRPRRVKRWSCTEITRMYECEARNGTQECTPRLSNGSST